MAEYIDRETVLALFNGRYDAAFVQKLTRENKEHWSGVCTGLNWGRNTITDSPAADVVEVKRGKWIKRHNERICSKCRFIYYNSNDDFNYCPNCGADMQGGCNNG